MTKDGTEERQDPSAEKQDASKGKQGTSEKTPETFTKDSEAKAVSDALAIAGRTAKAFEIREQNIKDAEVKVLERQKERDVAELEAAEPDDRPLIQRKQALKVSEIAHKQEREQLERDKLAHQSVIDTANATKLETDVIEIATKHEVDADKLKDLANKLGITGLEQIEELAKASSAKKPLGPDNGKTIGGGSSDKSPGARVSRALEKLK